jgi:hypothetical protein
MTLDFTLETYSHLCECVRQLDCPVLTVRGFLAAGQPERFVIVLRHDVDRRIGAALRMAELESEHCIAATYYVRATLGVFKREALIRLYELGHEVGYHYEVLARARGDSEKAIQGFEQDLERFREVVPVETVSAHGSPLSPWNNLDLWQEYRVEDHGILGDAVLGLSSSRLYYLTDTGRAWDAGRHNLRDRLPGREPPQAVHTTHDLIEFLEAGPRHPVCISAHPNRWAENWLAWCAGTVADMAINQAKSAVSLARSRGG